MPRPLPLVYIGNQYDRDEAFSAFFAPAAARFQHRVAGKWTRTADWPHVNFTGRCPFPTSGNCMSQRWRRCCCSPDGTPEQGR